VALAFYGELFDFTLRGCVEKGNEKGKNLTCIVKDIALCLASTLSTEKRRNEDLHAKPIYCRDQRP
jgi:hypothetical protein